MAELEELPRDANLALRFLLELCALAALAYWGYRTGQGGSARVGLALGAPLAAAVAWWAFVAPQAPRRLPDPPRLLVELVVFGSAAAGLAHAGRPVLAGAFGLAVAVNELLLYVWEQR